VSIGLLIDECVTVIIGDIAACVAAAAVGQSKLLMIQTYTVIE
jgi:hypothetical protein